MNKLLVSAAVFGVAASVAAAASAKSQVNCYGIAKAGKNDCPAYDSSHSCAGQAKRSFLPVDWVYEDTGEICKRKCGSPDKPGAPDPNFCNVAATGAGAGGNTTMPIEEDDTYTMPAN